MCRASSRQARIRIAIDQKLIAKYGIGVSRTSRARRKAVGIANVHYLRYQRRFLLLATHGFHPVLRRRGPEHSRRPADSDQVRGVLDFGGQGRVSAKASEAGLALRDSKWRARVQIERELYRGLKAYFEDIAVHRSAGQLARELADLPFEPYAPVRQQLLNLVRYINQRRKAANLEPLSFSVLRYRRRIVRPFGTLEMSPATVRRIVRAAGE